MISEDIARLFAEVRDGSIDSAEARRRIKTLRLKKTDSTEPEERLLSSAGRSMRQYERSDPRLQDHVVASLPMLPGSALIDQAIEAFLASQTSDFAVTLVERVVFVSPVVLGNEPTATVLYHATAHESDSETSGKMAFSLSSEGDEQIAASGHISCVAADDWPTAVGVPARDKLQLVNDLESIYSLSESVQWGDYFRTLHHVAIGEACVRASFSLEGPAPEAGGLDARIINSAFLSSLALFPSLSLTDSYLPLSIASLSVQSSLAIFGGEACVVVKSHSKELITFDADIYNDENQRVASIRGLTLKRVRDESTQSVTPVAQQSTKSEPIDSLELLLTEKIKERLPEESKALVKGANLMDLGVTSASLMELVSVFEQELELVLSPTLLFEYPSLETLIGYFREQHPDVLARGDSGAEKEVETRARPHSNSSTFRSQKEREPTIEQAAYQSELEHDDEHSIAIIGMDGRFALADTVDQFWKNIVDEVDHVREVPADHWDIEPWFNPELGAIDKTYCKWGTFIEGVDRFDAEFFNISPREAKWMDPQLRLLLESAYHAMEDAGVIGEVRGSDTGVFVGACFHDYSAKMTALGLPMEPYMGTGNSHTVLANRLSFLFNLRGPSIAYDTACSSSLVALHAACVALRNGECSIALVGGTNLLLDSAHYRYFSCLQALSPSGRCHSFDERADGYVPGECVGSVVLKPLHAALRDNDRIEAVIRGSATSHGGYTPSLTAPSVDGEMNVILKAWEDAGVVARDIGYVEAHGTGTGLGDPIEIASLAKAFRQHTEETDFCSVGTAKANIGHAEGAAGIAGLIKTVAQIRNGIIPRLASLSTLNPRIRLKGTALRIADQAENWASDAARPRTAGISSFGFSGAYAHVVVQQYVERVAQQSAPGTYELVMLTAKSERALHRQIERLSQYLSDNDSVRLNDLAYSLQVGRETFEYRMAVVVNSVEALSNLLDGLQVNFPAAGVTSTGSNELVPNKTRFVHSVDRDRELSPSALAEFKNSQAHSCDWAILGAEWLLGASVEWRELHSRHKSPARMLSLPGYPFESERFWLDEDSPDYEQSPVIPSSESRVLRIENVSRLGQQRFHCSFSHTDPFLADHRLLDVPVLPAVVYIELLLSAVRASVGSSDPRLALVQVTNLQWLRPLRVVQSSNVLALVAEGSDGSLDFSVVEADSENSLAPKKTLCTARVNGQGDESNERLDALNFKSLVNTWGSRPDLIEKCRSHFSAAGLEHGPSMQSIQELWIGESGVLARLKLPRMAEAGSALLAPAAADGAIQSIMALALADTDTFSPMALEVPSSVASLRISMQSLEQLRKANSNTNDEYWALGDIEQPALSPNNHSTYRVSLYDSHGEHLMTLEGLTVKPLQSNSSSASRMAELAPNNTHNSAPTVAIDNSLELFTLALLTDALAAEAQLSSDDVDPSARLERYGIDSIMITRMVARLESSLGPISRAAFFESQTLRELQAYFIANHLTQLKQLADVQSSINSASPELVSINSEHAATECHDLSSYSSPESHSGSAAIAIIGLAGTYAGARDLNALWQNLRDAKDSIAELPADRWAAADTQSERAKIWGGFVDGVAEFDARFFGIAPKDAPFYDPQERLFLQAAYHTLEDAGYTASALSEQKVGVLVGVMYEEYQLYSGNSNNKDVSIGGVSASIANRVSYHFDFKGLSTTIDSMCSSSLTAIHLACRAILDDELDLALAGGVNVSVHPNKYDFLRQGQFLSSDGRCRSFGAGGDGYVPGEGVGAILLKRLDRAIADGDNIHGVILGSAVNHGGRTHGFSIPSPRAQSAVITDALRRAAVPAASIGYIETHGTGTALGDPIEIHGLQKIYGNGSGDPVSIGSIKSNIGHCESAAGIAGLSKILLQMRHAVLAPSLHAEPPNPDIDFEAAGLQVNLALSDWHSRGPDGSTEVEATRRAALSSFGAGGSNAHMIVESYAGGCTSGELSDDRGVDTSFSLPILISARTADQLKQRVRDLLGHLQRENISGTSGHRLLDIAYTLRVGRESMRHRLAILVRTREELESRLSAWLDGHKGFPFWESRVESPSQGRGQQPPYSGQDAEVACEQWADGASVTWQAVHEKLFLDSKPRRVSLPGYPFEPSHYWITEPVSTEADFDCLRLVPEPAEEANSFRFECHLNGTERCLLDHHVNGVATLPGTAIVALMQSAVDRVKNSSDDRSWVLDKIRFISRCQFDARYGTTVLRVSIREADGGEKTSDRFRVLVHLLQYLSPSRTTGEHEKPVQTLLSDAYADLVEPAPCSPVDITNVFGEVQQHIDSESIYRTLEGHGLQCKQSHRRIVALQRRGEGVVASLAAQAQLGSRIDDGLVDIGLLDSALHALAGLENSDEHDSGPIFVPTGIERFELLGSALDATWAIVTHCQPSKQAETGVRHTNIVLCDDSGKVLIRIHGLATQALIVKQKDSSIAVSQIQNPTTSNQNPEAALLFCSDWCDLSPKNNRADNAILTLLVQSGPAMPNTVGLANATHWIELDPKASPGQLLQNFVAELPAVLKQLSTVPSNGTARLQIVLLGKLPISVLGNVHGCIASISREYGDFEWQLLRRPEDIQVGDIAADLQLARAAPWKTVLELNSDQVRQRSWSMVAYPDQIDTPWRESGVYVISGGGGGIGLTIAREIVRCLRSCSVYLLGRSKLSESLSNAIDDMSTDSARVSYVSVDVSDAPVVENFFNKLRDSGEEVRGVIHAAGVLRDAYFAAKRSSDLDLILKPKLNGIAVLDAATADVDLDFFVAFSSIASVFGNIGQSDYALANGAMDGYIEERAARVEQGAGPRGKSLSIAWPYWRTGGMELAEENIKTLYAATGLAPLSDSDGVEVFYRALMLENTCRTMVLAGDHDRIFATLLPAFKSTEHGADERSKELAENKQLAENSDDPWLLDRLSESLCDTLCSIVTKQLELPLHEVDINDVFTELGFDSVSLATLATSLEVKFGLSLSATLFYEHHSILALAKYLLDKHPKTIQAHYQLATSFSSTERMQASAPTASLKSTAKATGSQTRACNTRVNPQQGAPEAGEAIAVVGISCRFPKANALHAFWARLRDGDDCITEAPASRWDWRAMSGLGKTESLGGMRWGGFIEGIDQFDASFFRISAREAALMDPPQRLLMMHVWKVIEDAGYAPHALAGTRTALLIGTSSSGYADVGLRDKKAIEGYSATGAVASVGPNRMSFFLDLRGPSEPVETACSSSLVATHRALRLLRSGEIDVAITGGVNTLPTPTMHIAFDKAGMLSEDGRCKTFSEQANGYVRSEGVGLLMLKRLSDAEADGDHIYGLLRGSAENHGGRASSLTAPNPTAQAQLLESAYRDAGVDVRTVGYIEAHGTGTPLGDPIEMNGLRSGFAQLGAQGMDEGEVVVGSVKSNIGHTELAAGAAGLIKVLLQMQHRTLVESLHSERLNPAIDLEGSGFRIARGSERWERKRDEEGQELPLRAGVSSFGFGGVNAHVVLEEYVGGVEAPRGDESEGLDSVVLVLSARSVEQVREQASALAVALSGDRPVGSGSQAQWLRDVAFTLQVGREAMDERVALLVDTRAALVVLVERLEQVSQGVTDLPDVFFGSRKMSGDVTRLFDTEDGLDELVIRWAESGQWHKIIRVWVNGINIEWSRIANNNERRRLSLPSYPFQQQRHWIEQNVESHDSGSVTVATSLPVTEKTEHSEPDLSSLQSNSSAVSKLSDEKTGVSVGLEPNSEVGTEIQLVKSMLISSVAVVMHLDENSVTTETPLDEFGFDSISLTELAKIINEQNELELNATVFFEHTSIDALAAHLIVKYPGRWQKPAASTVDPVEDVAAPAVSAGRPKPSKSQDRLLQPKSSEHAEAIAVVGLSCAFPQAQNATEFWANLQSGRDCITAVPDERWNSVNLDISKISQERNLSWGGFLCGIDLFDPLFFQISPTEARHMDPQQRLLMMHVWKVIEDAGYAPHALAGTRTALLIGTGASGYSDVIACSDEPIEGYSATGVVPSVGPNRMSFFLDLRGPSEPVETACSSSLVATHRALRLLRSGEIDVAITGGVNTLPTPTMHIAFDKAGMLSEDGRCKTFSEQANGYVRSEGVGLLMLKRLSDAEADGDHIYGLLRGSAENHGGRASSLTAPNPTAQAQLLESAYRDAGVDVRTVGYIEAHGTGTPLGDPIEMNGLRSGFAQLGAQGMDEGEVVVGSVKSNIGHTELAAGAAGLIKVLLQMQHRTLVESLHSERLNPAIDLEGSGFRIARGSERWERKRDEEGQELPLRAGVSSFGFGGVNAHVVLEEYVGGVEAPRGDESEGLDSVVLVLSARSVEQVREQASALAVALSGDRPVGSGSQAQWLRDVAFTLQVGREAMDERVALLVDTRAALVVLVERLEQVSQGVTDLPDVFFSFSPVSTPQNDAFKTDEQSTLRTEINGWLRGNSLDLVRRASLGKRRRISLPTYPFLQERCWAEQQKNSSSTSANKRPSLELSIEGLAHGTSTVDDVLEAFGL